MRFFFSLVIVIIIWQGVFIIWPDSTGLMPSPFSLARSGLEVFSNDDIYLHIATSLVRIVSGFGLASVFGIILGLAGGVWSQTGKVLKTWADILRHIPPIAWIPLAVLWFGLGDTSAIFIVFLGAFFPIFSNSLFGTANMPEIYGRVSSSFEIGKWVYLRKIVWGFSLPYIFTGLKIGIGMAWMSLIAAELIGAQSGLGYYIQISRLNLDMDGVAIGMILIGSIGGFLSFMISRAEKKCVKWKKYA